MRNQIEFLLGDEAVSVSGIAPELTVLDWLRDQGRVGTKEGCAEGDCGACTVVVAERNGDRLRHRAVNSCIQPMVSLDGRQLITVEDLAGKGHDGAPVLHRVQQAMVEQHGSQCGFCTPGFVMSMFAMAHQPNLATPDGNIATAINESLAGNLCRCTGYAPIMRASREVLAIDEPDHFSRNASATLERLDALSPKACLRLAKDQRQMLAPRSLDELLKLLAQYPDAVMVAGATDVGLWLTKDLKRFETMIYVGAVEELLQIKVGQIDVGEESIDIGAAVTYSDAMPVLTRHFPDLRPMLARLGGLQVRNAGTIGGNIANGSPIGDSPPALIALGARLVLAGENGSREIDLEDFFIDYGKQDLRRGECVHSVRIPLPKAGRAFRVYKISKRFDQDISSVLGAFSLMLDGDKVADIRIACGGMAGVPARARDAEKALLGQPWTQATVDQACEAMAGDFQPISDWRASAEYRMLAAQNLLRRFFIETRSTDDSDE